MYESKKTPGKKFGSAFAGRRYDNDHQEEGQEQKHEEVESPVFEKGEQEGAIEGTDNAEGHPVVAEHGPAHKVVISHDEKLGRHHVMSHHKGGHVNESDHATAQEAHEEGGRLANVDVKKEHPEEAQQGAASEEDGFEMPDLA